jgi:flavin-dependent dehydrogenase
LALRKHAPQLSLVLIEGSIYSEPRAGEVLPAVARDLLDQLGVLEAFAADGHRLAHSVAASWGKERLFETHFIYSARGPAWHLDRARFDAFLAEQVAQSGVQVFTGVQMRSAQRSADGWTIKLSDSREVGAPFVVDATGRRAAFALKAGAQRICIDRLMAFGRSFSTNDHAVPQTLIESFPHGWWYTALAGDRRVVMCLTDVDIARRLELEDPERWFTLLRATHSIRSLIDGDPVGPLLARAANSVYLDPVCGNDWLAVGDAACAYDPLSSQGITKALRSGILAAYAIADRLSKADARGLLRYQTLVQRECDSYRRAHVRHYAAERRWPTSIFWWRRIASY